MRIISKDKLKQKLDNKEDIKLIFVLGEWHFRAKHIPGSIHLESPEKAKDILNPDDEIIVYCASITCTASIYAYHTLDKLGYKNLHRYAGGIDEWEKSGLPLEGEFASMVIETTPTPSPSKSKPRKTKKRG